MSYNIKANVNVINVNVKYVINVNVKVNVNNVRVNVNVKSTCTSGVHDSIFHPSSFRAPIPRQFLQSKTTTDSPFAGINPIINRFRLLQL